jgi:hypothetical protein
VAQRPGAAFGAEVELPYRHCLRGLIYEADGMTDVVMHGKVGMIAVAKDVISAIAKRDALAEVFVPIHVER